MPRETIVCLWLAALGGACGGKSRAERSDLPYLPGTCDRGTWTGDAEASTQAQVEELEGFTEVEGDLRIEGGAENLSPLHCLVSVGEHLSISGNPELERLDGLENVSGWLGTLTIRANAALSSLEALENLSGLNGLTVAENPVLAELRGLDSLEQVLSDVEIRNNDSLVALTSLEDLGIVEGALSIAQNDGLTSLSGLSTLSFAFSLTVIDNTALPECEAFRLRDRITIGQTVEIAGNDVNGVCP